MNFTISEHILMLENTAEKKVLRGKTAELDPALFRTAKFQKDMRVIVQKMRSLMIQADGVGLSANQAGIPHKFFVARAPQKDGKWKFYAIFNPKITKVSREKETTEEGCLSVPGKYGPVPRAYGVTLEGLNLQGKKVKIEAKGLLARIFQHEVDHLNGAVFIDKAKFVEDVKKSKDSSAI